MSEAGFPHSILNALFVAEDRKLAFEVQRAEPGDKQPPFVTTVWKGLGEDVYLHRAYTRFYPATELSSPHAQSRLGHFLVELGATNVGNTYTLLVARQNDDNSKFGGMQWVAALEDTPASALHIFPEHGSSPYMADEWDWQEGWWYPYSTFRVATEEERAAFTLRRPASPG